MKYDDASWHYEGEFPADLPKEAGATHIGMFLTWMLLHDFASEELAEDASEAIEALKARQMTGANFLIKELDEKLTDNEFTDEGNAFALAYYQGPEHKSQYVGDYMLTFPLEGGSLYSVADTWMNYDKLSGQIDARYRTWVADGRPEYIF